MPFYDVIRWLSFVEIVPDILEYLIDHCVLQLCIQPFDIACRMYIYCKTINFFSVLKVVSDLRISISYQEVMMGVLDLMVTTLQSLLRDCWQKDNNVSFLIFTTDFHNFHMSVHITSTYLFMLLLFIWLHCVKLFFLLRIWAVLNAIHLLLSKLRPFVLFRDFGSGGYRQFWWVSVVYL